MGFRIRGSHIIAVLLAGGLAAWMASGRLSADGAAAEDAALPPIAERQAEHKDDAFRVRHVPLMAEERNKTILVRGRTRADAVVTVRAETGGVLEQRLVAKGDTVSKGDLVCVIDRGAREAAVAQAKAQLAQAQTEYDANSALSRKGFASANKLTGLKAAVDAASAQLASAELELSRTELRASASGQVQDPIAEAGDMLSVGAACITLIDTDPMLFTGQVSERDIDAIETGMKADIKLVTGEEAQGTIRYIAPSADAQTRTFTVEIEFEPGANVRDGMTAEATISLDAETAFRVAPSWLTLADDGTIGIRTVNDQNEVEFTPVKILAQQKDGFWISGPKPGDRIITLGQEYVVAGEKVETELDTRFKDMLTGLAVDVNTGSVQ
ncbi:MAG: efflux RND transporter periplasmic adaptor subunit [Nitratireductor sp.]|nr:efflux RND transporter periplasmic adaptor subunit [Nitratireductor sp.]